MTLQNRVLPTGEIIAAPTRGTLMGNRGILHRPQKTLGTTRWQHPHWVTCLLKFKGRKRPLMAPGRYTELFFADEAVALAAGHRPCGECRRPEFRRFRELWDEANGPAAKVDAIDRTLHRDRVSRTREQVRHIAQIEGLPDGTFIMHADAPHLVWQSQLLRFGQEGYDLAVRRPAGGAACVLTPRSTVSVLAAGYRPDIHPDAKTLADLPA